MCDGKDLEPEKYLGRGDIQKPIIKNGVVIPSFKRY